MFKFNCNNIIKLETKLIIISNLSEGFHYHALNRNSCANNDRDNLV